MKQERLDDLDENKDASPSDDIHGDVAEECRQDANGTERNKHMKKAYY